MPKSSAQQRSNGSKSEWRGKPGMRDAGQRFVVVYRDGNGTKRDYGFTNDAGEAAGWVNIITKNPMWRSAAIRDRQAKKVPA